MSERGNLSQGVYLGIDVGSGSVRAVALDEKGTLLASAVENLHVHRPRPDYHEQSSDQIWQATCDAIRRIIIEIGNDKSGQVKSIGFDATCSLVVLDRNGQPLSVTPADAKSTSKIWDIIMWMDHRATDQANRINATKYDRLKYVGGIMSPELEPPKLLWLKENKPDVWKSIGHVMDLADFMTYKASGSLIRSQCTVVSKWMYQAGANGGRWDNDFYTMIGLPELCNSPAIGTQIQYPGSFCGFLTPEAESLMGLPHNAIRIATGIIDAHAGAFGLLGTSTPQEPILAKRDAEEKLIIISGTSACHLTLSKDPHFVKGVWGPNYGVILDGYWTNEAGQNVVGPVLDEVALQLVRMLYLAAGHTHDVFQADSNHSNLGDLHKKIIDELLGYEQKYGSLAMAKLAKDMHVWPDYRGNRSPTADANSKAIIAGIRMKADMDIDDIHSTCITYLAHIQALAYMTRYIIDTIHEYSSDRKPISTIYLCGGLQKNPIYVQTHADVCGMPVIVPSDTEVVARGAAILGANASEKFGSLMDAMNALSCVGTVFNPRAETQEYHEKKYKAFRVLGKTEAELRDIMKNE